MQRLTHSHSGEYEFATAEEVTLGEGEQRSLVDSLTVRFNGLIDFDPNDPTSAFDLSSVGNGSSVQLVVQNIDVSLGITIVTFGFAGAQTRGPNALLDADYRLDVDGALFAYNGSDVLGEDETFGEHTGRDDFFAKFGDSNGDKDVDVFDFINFRRTYKKQLGDAGFDQIFDYEGDDDVDIFDYIWFKRGYNK